MQITLIKAKKKKLFKFILTFEVSTLYDSNDPLIRRKFLLKVIVEHVSQYKEHI